ncbi:MAG: DMT family transporter [Caldisericota bacterium]|nr:DMT family transporter [Caldisericota bacterium]
MKKQKQSYTYAIIAVLLWSTVASAFKISLRYLDFLQLLFYASIASIIFLFVVLLIQNKLYLLKSYSQKDYLHSALFGFLNPFLYYIILFKAYSLLPAQEAQPLNYTWPIMLVLLSIPLLGQKVGLKSFFAISISFLGVLVISVQGNILGFRFANLNGALLALGSAVVWALFWIYNTRDKRDDIAKLLLNFIFGFIYLLIVFLFFSKRIIPDIKGFLGAIYVGLFEMGITFVLWSKALKLSKTTAKISNFIYLVPFLSLIWVHFLVGETILFSTIIGLIFIVIGIVLQQYRSLA